MRILIFLLSTTLYNFLFAATITIGSVDATHGIVKVKHMNSIKKKKIKANFKVEAGDLITTLKDSSAKLKLKDNSLILLGENSTIVFHALNNVEQEKGKIYYKITSKNVKNALAIKTPFAIIGIKGTEFIINAKNNDASVILREGLIGIESIKEEFELYKKNIQQKFDNFKSAQESAYEKYKQSQNREFTFIKKTKKFDLQKRKSVTFSGRKVKEQGWNKQDDLEFAYFEKLMQTMK